MNFSWPEGYHYDKQRKSIIHAASPTSSAAPVYVTGAKLTLVPEDVGPENEPMDFDIPLDTGVVEGTVPPGGYTFYVEVFTEWDDYFTGDAFVTLVPGPNGEITIDLEVNAPPVIVDVVPSNPEPLPGDTIEVTAFVEDQDADDELTYYWDAAGFTISGSGPTVFVTMPPAGYQGIAVISLLVDDGHGGVAYFEKEFTSAQPPIVFGITASDYAPALNDQVQLVCDAWDPKDTPLSFVWYDQYGWFDTSGPDVIYTVTQTGPIKIWCEAWDQFGMMDWNGIILNENGVLLAGLFADANLQNCVNTAFPTATYAHEVTGTLTCNNQSIVSVAGMGSLTGLTNLSLTLNQIVDVSPLTGMTNLTWLELSNNQIVDVSPLTGMTNLTTLAITNNQIVDVSPLTGMMNLTTLAITNNQIVDVSPLAGLTNLTALYLVNNLLGGQGVGQVDSLVTLTGANLFLANNLGMSCAEATTLIGALGTSVDISGDGVGALDPPTNGVNCTNP